MGDLLCDQAKADMSPQASATKFRLSFLERYSLALRELAQAARWVGTNGVSGEWRFGQARPGAFERSRQSNEVCVGVVVVFHQRAIKNRPSVLSHN